MCLITENSVQGDGRLLLNEFPKAELRFQEKQISGITFLQFHQLEIVGTYTFSLV